VPANVFGKAVNHQASLNINGLKKIGRRHSVIYDVDNALVFADLTNTLEICDLGARVRDGFYKDHFGFWSYSFRNLRCISCVDKRYIDALSCETVEQAVGVTKQEAG